jgi:hypothetical protein
LRDILFFVKGRDIIPWTAEFSGVFNFPFQEVVKQDPEKHDCKENDHICSSR